MKVSVVIPAYNEETFIESCLSCLNAQSFPCDEFEVILVDNGSTDRTAAIANRFKGKFALAVISKSKITISAVRNLGASLSKGDIVVFLDGDCLTQPAWIAEGLRLAPASGIWGAHYRIPSSATWVSRVWFTYQAKEQEGAVSFIPASNMFIRRSDFDALGGFDESIQTSEDVDICNRAHAVGMPVVAFRVLAVVHEGIPRNLLQFYRQNRWHGMQIFQKFMQNLPSTKNLKIVAISLYTFVMFWATVAALGVALVTHWWLPPILGVILLLMPSMMLSIGKAWKSKSITAISSLIVLYAVYLLARAAAVTRVSPRNFKSMK